MNLEIERKFLVINDEYKKNSSCYLCYQGYILNNEKGVVRVRVINNKSYITIKTKNINGSCLEFEYEIPTIDAMKLLELMCEKPIIEKKRYEINFDDKIWYVDEFLGENLGLVVAEIELKSFDENFKKPNWIGIEVTSDPKYFNSNLIKFPYSKWKIDNKK